MPLTVVSVSYQLGYFTLYFFSLSSMRLLWSSCGACSGSPGMQTPSLSRVCPPRSMWPAPAALEVFHKELPWWATSSRPLSRIWSTRSDYWVNLPSRCPLLARKLEDFHWRAAGRNLPLRTLRSRTRSESRGRPLASSTLHCRWVRSLCRRPW